MGLRPPPLYYTSFLCLIPSFYGQGTLVGKLYTVITALSILNHGKSHEEYIGKDLVVGADRVVVHFTGLLLTIESLKLMDYSATIGYAVGFQLCLLYAVLNYHVVQRHLTRTGVSVDILKWLHASFHLVSVIGGMLILHGLKVRKRLTQNLTCAPSNISSL